MNVRDYERIARARLPQAVYDFCSGGAGEERTSHDNCDAFNRLKFRPRVLSDTSYVDLATEVVGCRYETPVFLAPTAFNRLFHSDGELAVARAAKAAGTLAVVSTFSSVTIEDVAAAGAASWFQLYVLRDHGLTRELVVRAVAAGYQALVLTVDAPRIGARERDCRNRFALPPGVSARNLLQSQGISGVLLKELNTATIDPCVTWQTVEWLQSFTTLPLVLKGILHPDDAAQAAAVGVSSVIVSNHGGRQLDGSIASIDALPAIADRVATQCDVLLDGGVRRGTDVLKALACGARAVFIGRPYLWGLAIEGEAGVARVLTLLRDELELAMCLAGCHSVQDVPRSLVVRADGSSIR